LEFTNNLKQQEKQEKLKNCQDLGKTRMKIQEASEDLQTVRNSLPKFWGNLFEDEDLKRQKIEEFGPKKGKACA